MRWTLDFFLYLIYSDFRLVSSCLEFYKSRLKSIVTPTPWHGTLCGGPMGGRGECLVRGLQGTRGWKLGARVESCHTTLRKLNDYSLGQSYSLMAYLHCKLVVNDWILKEVTKWINDHFPKDAFTWLRGVNLSWLTVGSCRQNKPKENWAGIHFPLDFVRPVLVFFKWVVRSRKNGTR